MTLPGIEDLERLASRLALLTSEDGEAENAARAAGQLARRLGLSGGQLKAIFLAGVQATGMPLPLDPEALARLQGEAAELRLLLDRIDGELRAANRRSERLEDENEALRDALDRSRTARRVTRVAATVVVLAALTAGASALLGPAWRLRNATPPAGSALQRAAIAGRSGASLFRTPDQAAEALGRLPPGAPLPVRQLLWRGFAQWVETTSGGQVVYAPAAEIDLR